MFICSRHTYCILHVRHIIYDHNSSYVCPVYSRHKYHVLNVRHIIYDYQSLCLCIRDINYVSIMFDISPMNIVFMCISSRQKYLVLIVRHIIHDHPSLCLCLTEFSSVPLLFDILSMITVVHVCIFQRNSVSCSTYHLRSSFLTVSRPDKTKHVLNVWYIIYDHHTLCLCFTEIKPMSLVFDMWSMIIILRVWFFISYHLSYHIIYHIISSIIS